MKSINTRINMFIQNILDNPNELVLVGCKFVVDSLVAD